MIKEFTNREVSIKLHELGFYLPSLNYYEWTGAEEIEELKESCWLIDSVNVYTVEDLKKVFPENVAVNENVVEIGIKKEDNEPTKMAKVLIYLKEKNIIEFEDWT